jgi:uncharacterized protein
MLDLSRTFTFGPLQIDAAAYGSEGNAILGIRGSGKSYTATLIAERLHGAGIPFIAFDPTGIWRFLRVPAKGDGVPVVVAGGESGDLALTPATAPAIIEAAMQNGVSLVIDLLSSDLSKADWRRIVRDSMRLLLHKNAAHGLRHIFIEEAAEFVPQRVFDGEVYAEVEKLARIGGNMRLGYTLINQRAEEVNKAVLELCDNLFLHRQKGRNSLVALGKWLDVGNVREHKAIVASLSTMATGECWAWLAGSDDPVRVKVPEKGSFHPDRRVMRGADNASLPARGVDVSAFIATMKAALPAIAESADANDPKKLRAEIERLKRAGAGAEQIAAAEARGYDRGVAERDTEVASLRDAVRSMRAAIDGALGHLAAHVKREDGIATIEVARPKPPPIIETPGPRAIERVASVIASASPGRRSGAEMRVLKVLAQRHPARFTVAQWATLSGMSRRGGTWSNYVSKLRVAGYLEEGGGTFGVTRAGLAAADVQQPQPQTPEEVRAMWCASLGAGPARLVNALLRARDGLRRDALAAEVGMTPTGGTFGNYLSKLRTNGLIEEDRSRVRLVEELRGN